MAVQELISDHSNLFAEMFEDKRFRSFAEFVHQLQEFESRVYVRFLIRSSVLSYPDDPCVYRSLRYLCKYGDWGKGSQSLGIRKGRSKDRGCPARFTVIQRDGFLVVGPRSHEMRHNHECTEMEYRLDPSVRRLSVDERADVVRMLKYGTPASGIKQMVCEEYDKYLTSKDIDNIRARYAETAVAAATWEELAEFVSNGGHFRCTNRADGRIECVSFSLDHQVELFGKYPEVVCLDATYKVNRNRYCLLQFVVTDGLGHGRTVMYSLIKSERASMYAACLGDFKSIMGTYDRLRTFVVDMQYAQMRALQTAFDGKRIVICHFHMTRAIRRKTKNRVIWGIVKRMMRTTRRVVFSYQCNRLRRIYPGFFIYFHRVWLSHCEKWAMSYMSTAVTLGNLTNNRVESAHRWLKRDLCPSDTLLKCCKRLWLCARQMLIDYKCDVATSRIRRPIVPFNCAIASLIPYLTRYAAEKVLREWESSRTLDVRDHGGRSVVVAEVGGVRDVQHAVDLRFRRCSCTFNRLYSLPCCHLLWAYISRGIPLQRCIDRSRWLDSIQSGTAPGRIEYRAAAATERKSCPEVILLRRLRQMKLSLSSETYRVVLSKTSTLLDLYNYVLADEGAVTEASCEIPPLRERIAGPSTSRGTADTVIKPSTSTTQTVSSSSAPKRQVPPVDLDESEKENERPATRMS